MICRCEGFDKDKCKLQCYQTSNTMYYIQHICAPHYCRNVNKVVRHLPDDPFLKEFLKATVVQR